jgi:uncharacterized protein YggE
MRNKLLLLSSLLTTSVPALSETAGNIVMIGRGAASVAPESVSFNIRITSICYNTSQDASQANSKLANEALQVLENFKKGDRDKITATGGGNTIQTETTQIGGESRVLCEMKWRSENHLSIKIARIQDLPDLQDQLLAAVSGSGTVDPTISTQTYAEIGRPEFQIYPETSKKLRDTAQVEAFDDAKQQLAALSSRCQFSELRLTSITPAEYSYAYKLAGERLPLGGGSSTPVIPDEVEISAILRMEWAFNPQQDCQF